MRKDTRPEIIMAQILPPKTFRQLIANGDNFPPSHSDEAKTLLATAYSFIHTDAKETYTLGYIAPSVMTAIQALPTQLATHLIINTETRTVSLMPTTPEQRSEALAAIAKHWVSERTFLRLNNRWRGEKLPIFAPSTTLFATIERTAAPLFGFVSYYVYLIGYRYVESKEGAKELKIWCQHRSNTKASLDMIAAGGLTAGQNPRESIVRESFEEASLSEEVVARATKRIGERELTLNVVDFDKGQAVFWPGCGFGFEVELGEGEVPKVNDGEVEDFYLLNVEEVKERLLRGDFGHTTKVMTEWLVEKGEIVLEGDGAGHEKRTMVFPLMEG